MIDWSSNNNSKINNDIDCFIIDSDYESKIDDLQKKIEPWVTALFQSEHFSLLIGAGLPMGLTYLVHQHSARIKSTYDFNKATESQVINIFNRNIKFKITNMY